MPDHPEGKAITLLARALLHPDRNIGEENPDIPILMEQKQAGRSSVTVQEGLGTQDMFLMFKCLRERFEEFLVSRTIEQSPHIGDLRDRQ